MDFNQFDSVSAAEKGADCHLKHPATLKPLFDNPDDPTVDNGKPCLAVVLGAEAPSVRAASRARQKARAEADDGDEKADDENTLEAVHERMVEAMVPRVLGFKNVRKGKAPATKADAAWLFGLNRMNAQEGEMSFAEQVAAFSAKRGNYLGNASAD
ncbi:hypothetical protein PhaeoP83_01673 [Phaeobacter inhibens]|uniref:Uncharacterized protein n=1 Tax=Phaeobacter inhibens TaxID=221822 RepID=A0ABM6RDS5_9RHOB|nr:hypothetical protein [Phaeobacter inhibens]AUQ49947.1 hypothetical protein PhaeoP83_01673 [Phaeobacter inhibens]AUQ94503.1 hypothetical protein PhaeoP66_01721 [Phaeobacter inhibens]AUR19752.1 hypothetical protein PhaeoP80_01673 [Phaeobacter inhibens]